MHIPHESVFAHIYIFNIDFVVNGKLYSREMGYPDRNSLKSWYTEYIKQGDLKKESSRCSKYLEEQNGK